MKKILLILLIALASLPHLSAAVGDEFEFDGLNYKILSEDDLTVEVAKNSNAKGNIAIPSIVTYNGTDYTVTSIGESAFSNRPITNVTIPNSVTSIGASAFYCCRSLTSVTIPNSVTSIGNFAFYYCDSMTSVSIPNSVTSIGNSAFYYCDKLTSVTIPNSVTEIGYGPFSYCRRLTEINVEEGNEYFCSYNGVLYNFDKTILIQCPGAKKECEIPNSVTSISDYAFYYCTSLTSVSIPNSVTSIGKYTFYYCDKLTSVDIPNSVTSIGNDAFYNCSSLTSVTIPNSVTSIEPLSFRYCFNLTSVTIPNSVTSIGNYAFSGCSRLTSVDIPNSVTSIGISTFESCRSLISITIPNSVTSIGDFAFSSCSSLTSVTIPNSVTSIGNSAFSGCSSLTSVTIPNSVTEIGDYTFSRCSSLTSVTIPNSVTEIGDRAFSSCTNITKIINLNPTPQSITYYTFYDVPTDAVVYIPKGSSDSFKTADGWSKFKDFREMDANITLNPISVELNKGESVEITASVGKYDDMTIESDEWSSSNTDVATVNGGKVTAISSGVAEINYTVTDGYGVTYTESCTVIVKPIFAESIALDRTELVLTIGATDKLTATILPEYVTDKTVTWASSDDTIVKVDEEGNIQALALGEAVITATCGEKSATCKVTVNPILAESIALDRTELVLTIGATDKLTATVLPDDVTDKTVTWTSSDDTIVKVDEEGKIQALALGEATITAACGEQSATCKVTVNPILAESIALDRTELVLTIGATDKLTATVLPEDVTDKIVTWASSDESIATVDEDGNVTAIAEGEAVITATCGEVSASCNVTVEGIVTGIVYVENDDINITVNGTELTVETSRLSAKVTIVRQDGAVIYTGENRGLYYLVRGLYIVVVDNATQKIVIN